MNDIEDHSERIDLVKMIVDNNYGLIGEKMRPMVVEKCKGDK